MRGKLRLYQVAPRVRGAREPWTVPHVLRIADIADPDRLNPYLSQMDVTYDLSSLIYSYLVVADDRGQLVGDLAREIPTVENGGISRDGKTYVYHLRRGVVWHDGAPFTAADVMASWRAVMDPRNNTFEREGYDRAISVAAPGPYEVVVLLGAAILHSSRVFSRRCRKAASRFCRRTSSRATAILTAGRSRRSPIGTGPFAFVSWSRGDRIVLKRFDRYFKGRPKLARIEIRFLPSDQTIAAELAAHRVDLVVAPQTSLVDQYRSVRGVNVSTAPWNAQASLAVNARTPGLDDAAVRRAIAQALPYREIVDDVTRGLYAVPRNVIAPTAIGYVSLPPRAGTARAAAALLDAAGWKTGSDGVRARRGVRLAFTLATIADPVIWSARPCSCRPPSREPAWR